MKAVILTSLLIVSFVSASPLVNEELDEEVSRPERAIEEPSHWDQNQPEKIGAGKLKCPAGKYAKVELDENENLKSLRCVQCEAGKYVAQKGLFESCAACPENGERVEMCTGCNVGEGWNEAKAKCERCEVMTFNDVTGSKTKCRKCPKFHDSKKGAEKCTMNCPAGYEPNEDKTSCRPCGFGTYKNKADSRGNNGHCKSCCGKNPDCGFKWTLTNGADSKDQCVRMNNKQKECFEPLMETLTAASQFMRKEDDEDRRLHRALCRMPNVNLEDLKNQYDQCKEEKGTLKDGEIEKQLLPKLAAGDKFLGLDRILDGDIRECESQDILDGTDDGGKEPEGDGGDKGDPGNDETGDGTDSPAGIAEGEWDHNNDRKDDGSKPVGDDLKE